MLKTLPPVISLLLLVGMVAAVLWIVCEVGRRYSVRGSRPRYVFAGVERALRYPAGGWLAVSGAVNFHFHLWADMAINALGFAMWIVVLIERRDQDDDDFWSDVAKRLRRLLRGPQAASGHA